MGGGIGADVRSFEGQEEGYREPEIFIFEIY